MSTTAKFPVKHIPILMWITAGCSTATGVSDVDSFVVCVESDTIGYFHGDFDNDGKPDSIQITNWRCW